MCSLTENGFGYLLLADIGIAVWHSGTDNMHIDPFSVYQHGGCARCHAAERKIVWLVAMVTCLVILHLRCFFIGPWC